MSIILARTATPSAVQRPARVILLGLVLLLLVLLAAPWQQTASGLGRVVAFSPTDRVQLVEAPIKGRVKEWHVVEGSSVRAGDRLVELIDVDPLYIERLELEHDAIASRMAAAVAQADAYARQVTAFEQVKVMAVQAAERKIEGAAAKVEAAKRKLEAERAGLRAATLNGKRLVRLQQEGLVSERDNELAAFALAKAETGVGSAAAALGEARAGLIATRAQRMVKESEAAAKIASADGSAKKAAADAAKAAGELAKLESALARQASRIVNAPADGVVLALNAGLGAEIVKEGDALATVVPKTSSVAVEVWIDGNDVPLVHEGRRVRLQFEGWPAVQFAGWPSVAVGTFGGLVSLVDAQSRREGGAFRVLIVPDPDDLPWPEPRYLRQGVKSKAWVMLDEVRLGYELWRRANGFPATTTSAPKATKEKE